MIHILDHQTDKLLGDSNKYRDDNHFESLKDGETFDFTEPINSKISPYLNKKNRVIIPVDDGFFREFIIHESIQHENEIEVFTIASYIELQKDEPIAPITLNSQTVNTAMDYVLSNTDWQRGISDYSGIRTITFDEYINPYNALRQLTHVDNFDLDLRFRIETKGGKVIGRFVDMIEKQGEWRGKEVVSGKDLISAKRTEMTDQVVTALYGIGPEKEDGTREIVVVKNEEARQVWGRKGKHLWGIYEPQTEDLNMTVERLTQLTEMELNKRISALVQYKVEGVDIEHVFGREHEKIRIGDDVRIKATEYNPPIYLDSRIIAREGPIRNKSQKKYTLGEFIEYTEDDVKKNLKLLEKQIAKKISEAQLVNYAEKIIPEQPTEPVNPDVGDKWVDTAESPFKLKLFDGIEWKTVKGDPGEQGPIGPKGDQGIKGEKGSDGLTAYTHIAYADDENGNGFSQSPTGKEYIGMYADHSPTDSSDPSDYNWSLIKGADGSQGIPGPKGDDGHTPYFHTAWANNETGTSGFSTTDSVNKLYIGTYTDFVQSDSTDPSRYSWTKLKGDKGDTGSQGPKGDKGEQGPEGPAGKDGIAHMGPLAPSNPALNGTWFETDAIGKVIAIKKWTGSSWETAKMDAETLSVEQLSALSANLGNVTAGHIQGVTMNLANGKLIVDDQGNVKFSGDLEGANGTFYGVVETIVDMPAVKKLIARIGEGEGYFETHHYFDGTTDRITVNGDGVHHGSDGVGNLNDFEFNSKNGFVFTSTRGQPAHFNTDIRLDSGRFIRQLGAQALSLQNGWVNAGGIYPNLVFYEDTQGYIYIKGSIKDGTVGTGSPVARLPVGYRPSYYMRFPSAQGHDLHISTNGYIMVGGGSNTIVSFDGILFNGVVR
ncbi:phage tail spike protein [Virgibacillus sp. W0430]|uniref:phage tail spike protein n=1 Tax=Virgibacillus sp. W0430 TaxID=3391580 RepID=UPI003F46989E